MTQKSFIKLLLISSVLVILVVLVSSVVLSFFTCPQPQNTWPAEKEISIFTDKTEYEQGETLKITVKNGLNKSIWDFAHCGPNPFWNLQKFDGNEWKELNFSLPHQDPRQKKEKEICDFVMCERPELTELKPNLEINYDWSVTTICEWPLSPIGIPTTEPKIIKEGTYRVFLTYGFSKDPSFSEVKTIYSNEFTIK